jgi:hypothetical protein
MTKISTEFVIRYSEFFQIFDNTELLVFGIKRIPINSIRHSLLHLPNCDLFFRKFLSQYSLLQFPLLNYTI